jgi:hypothetical protein
MDPSEIQSLIEELQSVSLDMDPEQLANTHKACAVLEDMATERCREVIRVASRGPLLQVFMSDAWSCDMRNRVASAHGDVRVDRRGRMRMEFVLQRAIVKCQRGHQWIMAVKVQRPKPLGTRKCAHIWAAACDLSLYCHCQGINVLASMCTLRMVFLPSHLGVV